METGLLVQHRRGPDPDIVGPCEEIVEGGPVVDIDDLMKPVQIKQTQRFFVVDRFGDAGFRVGAQRVQHQIIR